MCSAHFVKRTRVAEHQKQGLRCRISPTCTLSQNGYGDSWRLERTAIAVKVRGSMIVARGKSFFCPSVQCNSDTYGIRTHAGRAHRLRQADALTTRPKCLGSTKISAHLSSPFFFVVGLRLAMSFRVLTTQHNKHTQTPNRPLNRPTALPPNHSTHPTALPAPTALPPYRPTTPHTPALPPCRATTPHTQPPAQPPDRTTAQPLHTPNGPTPPTTLPHYRTTAHRTTAQPLPHTQPPNPTPTALPPYRPTALPNPQPLPSPPLPLPSSHSWAFASMFSHCGELC